MMIDEGGMEDRENKGWLSVFSVTNWIKLTPSTTEKYQFILNVVLITAAFSVVFSKQHHV